MSYQRKYISDQIFMFIHEGIAHENEYNKIEDLINFMDEILFQIQREIFSKVAKTCTIKLAYNSSDVMDIPPIFQNNDLFIFEYKIKHNLLELSLEWDPSDNDKMIEFVRVKYEKLDAFIKTLIDLPKLLI